VTLRVAVWGIGPHAQRRILPALAATPSVRLAGVYSRKADVVAAAAGQYGCASWSTPDAMLADAAIDAVFIATPTGVHAEQGLAVIAAGKQCWIEKPIAPTLAGAERLVAASKASGVSLAEGLMYLYHPQFEAVRAMLRAGRLGYIHAVASRFGIPPLERESFRTDPALGGGAFLDLGCYPLSLADALCGADLEVRHAERVVAPGSRVDTSGRALLRDRRGALLSVEWAIGVSYRNDMDIWGTEGSVHLERVFAALPDQVPVFRLFDRHGTMTEEMGTSANQFVAMFTAFAALARDAGAAQSEREAILRRAALADRIRQFAPSR
jgi:NDP-hexose-3-ketoreductase